MFQRNSERPSGPVPSRSQPGLAALLRPIIPGALRISDGYTAGSGLITCPVNDADRVRYLHNVNYAIASVTTMPQTV